MDNISEGGGAQAPDTVSPIIIEIARCFISCQTRKTGFIPCDIPLSKIWRYHIANF